jgi:hypothetical protein
MITHESLEFGSRGKRLVLDYSDIYPPIFCGENNDSLFDFTPYPRKIALVDAFFFVSRLLLVEYNIQVM